MMGKVCLGLFAAVVFAVPVFSQTSSRDIERLRDEVGFSDATRILKGSTRLPLQGPLKVHFTINHNPDLEREFNDWVAEWNRTNGVRYGELQIVSDIEQADIAAIIFKTGASKVVREDSVGLKVGKVDQPNDRSSTDFIWQKASNDRVEAKTTIKTLPVPIYSYFLARGPNDTWHVNFSRLDELTTGNKPFPERRLRAEIERALKKR
jgi:hypothetical protein